VEGAAVHSIKSSGRHPLRGGTGPSTPRSSWRTSIVTASYTYAVWTGEFVDRHFVEQVAVRGWGGWCEDFLVKLKGNGGGDGSQYQITSL
jgi:hypothetical protein